MSEIWFGEAVLVDGSYWGMIVALVVDPEHRRLTHLVVQPPSHPEQGRLIPLGLFTFDQHRALLEAGESNFQSLPRVRDSTFQRPSRPVLAGRDWDVGIRHKAGRHRYTTRDLPRSEFDDERTVEIVFDRIPRGSIELRAESPVSTPGGTEAGRVAGLVLLADDRVTAVLVARAPRLLRQVVVMPDQEVVAYQTDRVIGALGIDQVGSLPRAVKPASISRRRDSD